MQNTKKPHHFKGKKAIQHVIDAHIKGRLITEDTHGHEISGSISSFCDTAKDISVIMCLLSVVTMIFFKNSFFIFSLFFIGLIIWKTGRSALLGRSRLQRLHRLIEEERWEIEHHRDQEREELKALYEAKGFSGTLLEEIIDVLMADDNRLLQVMLEEEMGLVLQSYDHPLKQACGAFLGSLFSSLLLFLGFYLFSFYGVFISALIIIALSSAFVAKWEKNQIFNAMIWNLGITLIASLSTYYLCEWVKNFLL